MCYILIMYRFDCIGMIFFFNNFKSIMQITQNRNSFQTIAAVNEKILEIK